MKFKSATASPNQSPTFRRQKTLKTKGTLNINTNSSQIIIPHPPPTSTTMHTAASNLMTHHNYNKIKKQTPCVYKS